METRKLKEEEYQAALQLALDVFMLFEAPIYPEEGIQMDGGHGAAFLESLQKTILAGIYKNR